MEWESLNAKAELARMHRDGHCHQAVMWYAHHLPESMKTLTLCESKGRGPKNRSLTKGTDSNLPGWHPKETAS